MKCTCDRNPGGDCPDDNDGGPWLLLLLVCLAVIVVVFTVCLSGGYA